MDGALERLVEEIRKDAEGTPLTFTPRELNKNNDTKHYTIGVRPIGQPVEVNIYVDDILEAYDSGQLTDGDAVDVFMERVSRITKERPTADVSDFASLMTADKGAFLETIRYAVVNAEWNKELLAGVPHRNFLDLAIIYKSENRNQTMSMTVTNDLMEYLGIKIEELEEAAKNHKRAYTVTDMLEVMMQLSGSDKEANEIREEYESGKLPKQFILSTMNGNEGGSIILYPEFFEKCAVALGSDLVVVPSSKDDYMVFAYEHGMTSEMFADMIQHVNQEGVIPEDRLSNHPYFYEKGSMQVTIW